MKVNRRTTLRLLATAGALAQTASAQDAAPQPPTPAADLQSARDDLKSDSQRVAAVPLPRATEPAFQFRA